MDIASESVVPALLVCLTNTPDFRPPGHRSSFTTLPCHASQNTEAPTSTSWSPRAMAAVSSCCSVGEGERGPRASGKGAGASKGDTGTLKQNVDVFKTYNNAVCRNRLSGHLRECKFTWNCVMLDTGGGVCWFESPFPAEVDSITDMGSGGGVV